jgi:hypothetical protein
MRNVRRRLLSLFMAGGLIAGAAGATLFAPVAAGAKSLGPGLVPHAVLDLCSKSDPNSHLDFDFAGRMPAGKRFYTVTSGHAHADWFGCSPVIPLLQMTGVTGQGITYQWTCTGGLHHLNDGVPLEQIVEPVHELLFVPDQLRQLRIGPGAIYKGNCTTAGKPGSFKLNVLLETVQNTDPDPDFGFGPSVLVGAYVAVLP